jgi:hypothetical protein
MSSTSNITLLNVDHAAIARVDVRQTGAWLAAADVC